LPNAGHNAGDRRVSRTERTKWRVTFRQLATDAQLALHAEDTAPGERAMELMIDLARHAEGSFRSEDPLEAARFVLSRAVSALWETVLAEHGFARFAARAASQLIRWESAYGWSNGTGAGKVAEREIALADALALMLATPDMRTGFADAYLAGLDRIASAERPLTDPELFLVERPELIAGARGAVLPAGDPEHVQVRVRGAVPRRRCFGDNAAGAWGGCDRRQPGGDRLPARREDDPVKRLQLPVAAVQGIWMRSTIKVAPPATGPTSGTVGTTSRTPLCIAVVGESTSAGAGSTTTTMGSRGVWHARSPRVPNGLSSGRWSVSSVLPPAGSATDCYRSSARTSTLPCCWPAATTS
jgi:hypothetical protein